MREDLFKYILEQYGVEPDYPWDDEEDYAVFRHRDNRKWFALVMRVRKDRVGLPGDDLVDVVNLKIDDPILHDTLIHEKGIVPGYHMNKEHWLTILLDGTAEDELITELFEISYSLTKEKKKRRTE